MEMYESGELAEALGAEDTGEPAPSGTPADGAPLQIENRLD
jgi:hypothetical protein